jgi:predicted dehydrogenase
LKESLTIGIIGAGSFAAFAAKAFTNVKGVTIAAVSDINEQVGQDLSKKLNAVFYPAYNGLLQNRDIDLVYIATPPFLHVEISKNAIHAGKHVICEKPGALGVREAVEVKLLASERGLLYVVNLMQRYNQLYGVVKKIVDEKILGDFLHGYFENYASDENLNNEHWFWDEKKSGGIFTEHAVHFFDLFSGWLGKGKLINSLQVRRKNFNTSTYDRVQATVLYAEGPVNFYHGFDQPEILDRQEMKLEFERGDVTLHEWIPVKIRIYGLLKNSDLKTLSDLLVGASITSHKRNQTGKTAVDIASRIGYDYITIESGKSCEKQPRYQEILTAMLEDQWEWIRDNNHVRTIDANNAIEALTMADHAKALAQNF